jgi:hypothetical protein
MSHVDSCSINSSDKQQIPITVSVLDRARANRNPRVLRVTRTLSASKALTTLCIQCTQRFYTELIQEEPISECAGNREVPYILDLLDQP